MIQSDYSSFLVEFEGCKLQRKGLQLLILFLIINTLLPVVGIAENRNHLECDVSVAQLDCDEDGTPNGEDIAPLDPCIGGKISLENNDCDEDGLTVGQGDTDDHDFCVPIPQPACENYQAIEEEMEIEMEMEFEEETGGIMAIITNPCQTEVEDYSDCDGDGTPNDEDEDPFDACTGWTIQLQSNDCDGDGITVGDGDTDDYDFCVPVEQSGCESSSLEEEEVNLEVVENNGIMAIVDLPMDCIDPLDCDGDGTPNLTDEDPFNPCVGGTKSLATNDCDGDGVTVGEGDTDDFDFCVPKESPECTVENSITDTDAQTVLIAPCDDAEACYISVAVKALLQGAYDEDNPSIMHDKLRALNYLPIKEPYRDLKIYDGDPIPFTIIGKGDETIREEVLNIIGEDAIVDWVFLQFHAENNPENIIATRSALIQRDGDVVEVDGVSPVKVQINPGKYYISIRHRNHLGVMTKTALILSKTVNSVIDFSNLNTPTYQLEDNRKKSNHAQRRIDDLNYLWGGNSNGDWATIYQGPGLDQTKVFYDIFVDDNNKGPDGFPNYNYIKRGYNISDSNMDGEIRYQGPNNDVDDLQFFNIILHPDNPGFFSNKIIYEQIPTSQR